MNTRDTFGKFQTSITSCVRHRQTNKVWKVIDFLINISYAASLLLITPAKVTLCKCQWKTSSCVYIQFCYHSNIIYCARVRAKKTVCYKDVRGEFSRRDWRHNNIYKTTNHLRGKIKQVSKTVQESIATSTTTTNKKLKKETRSQFPTLVSWNVLSICLIDNYSLEVQQRSKWE